MSRRGRDGDPLDDFHQDDDVTRHHPAPDEPHACDHGWLDRDSAVPCPRCRPWLIERRAPRADELDALRRGG